MPPTTRSQLKLAIWHRLRLPTELVEQIVVEIIGDSLHQLFTSESLHDLPPSPRPRRRKQWNGIRTLLRLSHQYRAVTAQILTRLFFDKATDGTPQITDYQVLCKSVNRMHRLAAMYKLIRSKSAEPGACRDRALEQDPALLSRPFARVYFRVNSSQSFLEPLQDGDFLQWDPSSVQSGTVAESSGAGDKSTTTGTTGCNRASSDYCDAITWRGFRRLADVTYEMLLVMSLNLLARIYRHGFGGTKSFGPKENYATEAMELWKPLISDIERRWREVAAQNHVDLAPDPQNLRGISPDLIQTSEIGPTLGVLDWLSTASHGRAKEISKLTALLDDVQIAFDLGGPPGALKNQILQITNS